MRVLKKYSIFVFSMLFIFFSVYICYADTTQIQTTETPEELRQLYAQSAVLMDADSGRVLFEKNGYEQMPMASTTKIMTCILALENGNLEDEVIISSYAASQPKVHLGMYNGQKFRLRDLLYSLMLESHNDSAVAIAEHIGGSVEEFAAMMNQKARDLGCQNTYFITPNGLDAKTTFTDENGNSVEMIHSTTAADLATIMMYCIRISPQKEEFLNITRTISHSFTDIEKKQGYSCNNHNAFLSMMEGALSGKTGFTNNAGYCYVGALKRDGKTFIVALLACGWPNNKTYKWADTKKLMNYGLSHYEYQTIWEEVSLSPVKVLEGVPKENDIQTDVYVNVKVQKKEQEEGFSYLLGDTETIETKVELKEEITAPIKEGTVVGSVQYFLGEELIRSYPIVTEEGAERIDFRWCLKKILTDFGIGKI